MAVFTLTLRHLARMNHSIGSLKFLKFNKTWSGTVMVKSLKFLCSGTVYMDHLWTGSMILKTIPDLSGICPMKTTSLSLRKALSSSSNGWIQCWNGSKYHTMKHRKKWEKRGWSGTNGPGKAHGLSPQEDISRQWIHSNTYLEIDKYFSNNPQHIKTQLITIKYGRCRASL
jgi:hypothetical protein